MNLLMDTHAWLWFVLGEARLSTTARDAIQAGVNTKFVSPVSYWEVAIKVQLGRYSLALPYPDFLRRAIGGSGFEILHISPRHAELVAELPHRNHRDPFDRMLAAQSLATGFPIVSADEELDQYGVRRIW